MIKYPPVYLPTGFHDSIISSLVHSPPIAQILRKSTGMFLSYLANEQTDEQTNTGQNITPTKL